MAFPMILPSRVLGRGGVVPPNEMISLGVIGYGPRCSQVIQSVLSEADVRCIAICDVQLLARNKGKRTVDAHYGNQDCAVHRDFRELLARSDIDAVLIATGDRWHATASVTAAEAGKDVYSEKPCGMNMAECDKVEAAMLRCARVYQAGTQRRCVGNFRHAVQLAQSGKLGKLRTLHALAYRPGANYNWLPAEPEPPVEEVDWEMWLGPSPWRPYHSKYVQGGWRGYDDLEAGGGLLDWGAHTVDLCQWANQADDTVPVEYEAQKDNITARYANGVRLVIHFTGTPSGNKMAELGFCPVRFEGAAGWVATGDNGYIEVHPDSLKSELRQLSYAREVNAAGHARDFFNCVRSRGKTVADPGVMRHTHTACFAAAMAWQLNRKLTFDAVKCEFLNAPHANRLRSRALRVPWSI